MTKGISIAFFTAAIFVVFIIIAGSRDEKKTFLIYGTVKEIRQTVNSDGIMVTLIFKEFGGDSTEIYHLRSSGPIAIDYTNRFVSVTYDVHKSGTGQFLELQEIKGNNND